MNSWHELLRKWVDASSDHAQAVSFRCSDHVLIACLNSRNQVTGFTLLEPRDLNEDISNRLKKRLSSPDYQNSKFRIFMPDVYAHRIEKYFSYIKKEDVIMTSFLDIKHQNNYFLVKHRLKIVCIDDSKVILKLLEQVTKEIGFVDIVKQVSNSTEAVETILKTNPDVVTLDIQMPAKSGVEVINELMQIKFYPTIMVSALSMDAGSLVFDALNNGAVDFLQKPQHGELEIFKENLKHKLLSAATAKNKNLQTVTSPQPHLKAKITQNTSLLQIPANLIWCIGSSTGGTQALTQILTALPTNIPPILIVQHIPPVFSKAFAESLNSLCPFAVKEAENGELIKANNVYIAPGGLQMGLNQNLDKISIEISDGPTVNRFKPSVDFLFASVAKLNNTKVVAAILTGMGKDGAEGLLQLKMNGKFTIAQDEASSAVFGMPRAAIELGAAKKVCSLDSMAETLLSSSLV